MLGDGASSSHLTSARPPASTAGALAPWLADLEARRARLVDQVATVRAQATARAPQPGAPAVVEDQIGGLILDATRRLERERSAADAVAAAVLEAADDEAGRIARAARAEVELLGQLVAAVTAAPDLDLPPAVAAAPELDPPTRLAV